MVDTEKTAGNMEGGTNSTAPAAEGGIQMEYSSDELLSLKIGAVTKKLPVRT
jgi:hypothetical protein